MIVVPGEIAAQDDGRLGEGVQGEPGGKVSWGGGSAGGTDHILVGLIAKAVGVDPARINYVAFKGGGEALPAILGGHVTAGASNVGEFADQVKSGRLRALAVSSPTDFAGIASLKSQGIDVELGNWRGVFGGPGLSPQQRDALVKMVRAATETPAWKATLDKFGWAPVFLGEDEYQKFLQEETRRTAAVIEALGIRK